jgi:biotin carboxyl carrier protein
VAVRARSDARVPWRAARRGRPLPLAPTALLRPSRRVGSLRSRSKGPALSGSALRPRPATRRLPALVASLVAALVAVTVVASDSAASVGDRVHELAGGPPPAGVVQADAAAWLGASAEPADGGEPTRAAEPTDEPDSDATPDADPAPEAPPAPEAFGQVDDLRLLLPSRDSVVAGFHQSSSPSALTMTPVGDRHVLPSRGRGTAPTSAVDIVLVDEDPVLAPVSGTVAQVAAYELYGRHADQRIVIAPDEAPHLEVVVIHVAGVHVEEGARVEAGRSVLADTARRFPFRSQVDELTAPDAWPHVHLEVRRAEEV